MTLYQLEIYSNGTVDTTYHYFTNGQIRSKKYALPENEAMTIFYTPQGGIIDTLFYKGGSPYKGGEMEYVDKGNRFDEPMRYITYEKGIYNGPYIHYHPNGQPYEKGWHRGGKKKGQ
jgi:hypothetical protein